MQALTELQQDALSEVFNIGVGRAASGLSMIVNEEVLLSAPTISLLPATHLQDLLPINQFKKLSTVSQYFSGPFSARALLVFPENNALAIVGHMLGDSVSPSELSEYEQEAMCEVGNIVLNACLSALADLFSIRLEGSLPEHQFTDAASIRFSSTNDEEAVLVLRVLMSISQQQIEGHIVFALSVDSLQNMLNCLNDYLRRQGLEP